MERTFQTNKRTPQKSTILFSKELLEQCCGPVHNSPPRKKIKTNVPKSSARFNDNRLRQTTSRNIGISISPFVLLDAPPAPGPARPTLDEALCTTALCRATWTQDAHRPKAPDQETKTKSPHLHRNPPLREAGCDGGGGFLFWTWDPDTQVHIHMCFSS